jgi:hypothetical protein
MLLLTKSMIAKQSQRFISLLQQMHKEIRAFNVKYQSFILSQCKFAHKYNVAASPILLLL